MALFLSKSVHKVDKKGRVSVPAAFRAALGQRIDEGLALTIPLNGLNAIEGAPLARVYERIEQLEELNSDSDEHGALALMTLGNMRQQTFDGEGRIVLPEDFVEHAGIEFGQQALFVGLGKIFQIWEPAAFDAHYLRAQEIARKNIGLLKSRKRASTEPEADS